MNNIGKFIRALALLSIVCCLTSYVCLAQKYDNSWLWGIYPDLQNDTLNPYRGNGRGDFADSVFISQSQWQNMAFSEYNVSMADTGGNLLFYTNGMWIMDSSHQIILNGDSLGYGYAWEIMEPSALSGSFGMRGPWCMLNLPMPDNDSINYLFHRRGDGAGGLASICFTIIERQSNAVVVTSKNNVISTVNPTFGNIAACRHGNGRDWWILYCDADVNCYRKFLLENDGLSYAGMQCIGRNMSIDDLGKTCFSPDGTKMVRTAYKGACDLFNFDRCSGELSIVALLDTFHVTDSSGQTLYDGIFSADYSPDCRYLYLSGAYFILQYDLSATDVNASRDTVGGTDGWDTGFTTGWTDSIYPIGVYTLSQGQLAPDGKIYYAPFPLHRFFSTIDNPNGLGDSCHFSLRSTSLPKWNEISIPYFPNYRLGPLLGSACDTVYNSITESYWGHSPWLKIYPNPAQQEVKLDYNWVEWEKYKAVSCELRDARGTAVASYVLPKYSSWQMVDVGRLQAGMYTVALRAMSHELREVTLATAKLVKE